MCTPYTAEEEEEEAPSAFVLERRMAVAVMNAVVALQENLEAKAAVRHGIDIHPLVR